MRVKAVVFTTLFVCPLALSAPVSAQVIKVKSGVPTAVAGQTIYNPDSCQYGALPSARITQPPAHGSAETRKYAFVVPAGKACAGMTFKGTSIVYTSARGYRGPDQIGFEFSWDTYVNSHGTTARSGVVGLAVD